MENFNIFQYSEKSPSGLVRRSKSNKFIIAGSKGDRYWNVQIDNKPFRVHRIVWELVNGSIPNGLEIDHIDGNGFNNRISNLRICNRNENSQNRKRPSNNTSGVKGVHFCKSNKSWVAKLRKNGQYCYKKYFKEFDDAVSAIKKARELAHGQFSKHV